MKKNRKPFDYTTASLAAISMACTVVLAGCDPGNATGAASADNQTSAKHTGTSVPARERVAVAPRPVPMGQVTHIETLTERPKGTGAGAVAGGVLGGVAGHQIGSGRGNDAATVAGAIGGAVLGNKIERDRKEQITGYDIQVRMDSGETRSFHRTQLNGVNVGDRVRVDGGNFSEV